MNVFGAARVPTLRQESVRNTIAAGPVEFTTTHAVILDEVQPTVLSMMVQVMATTAATMDPINQMAAKMVNPLCAGEPPGPQNVRTGATRTLLPFQVRVGIGPTASKGAVMIQTAQLAVSMGGFPSEFALRKAIQPAHVRMNLSLWMLNAALMTLAEVSNIFQTFRKGWYVLSFVFLFVKKTNKLFADGITPLVNVTSTVYDPGNPNYDVTTTAPSTPTTSPPNSTPTPSTYNPSIPTTSPPNSTPTPSTYNPSSPSTSPPNSSPPSFRRKL